MSEDESVSAEKIEPEWHGRFPNVPGWYWCYQTLPHGNGTNISPIWVDDNMHLPRNISAYYGPLEPPAVPDELVPEEYKEKPAETTQDNA